jgi:chemotaxis protein methyltransferase CheR
MEATVSKKSGDQPDAQDSLSSLKMKDKTFARFRDFIETDLGIKMPESKRTMLQSRLQKRLRACGINNYEEYCAYVFSPEGLRKELHQMINVVTTNKTDFFREPHHFDFLVQTALPYLIENHRWGVRKKVTAWSAACSTGEEPYSLAMVLSEFQNHNSGFHFSILATDISTRVLQTAANGIYEHSRAEPIPLLLRKKYLLKSKDQKQDLVRLAPELRDLVQFQRLNLMDDVYDIHERMDIIFCRNVIIYFDRPTQEQVLNRLCRHLIPGGFMFMGHSETLGGLKVPLTPVATTIYQKVGT